MVKAIIVCVALVVGLAACQPTGSDLPPVGEELMAIEKARCEARGDIWGTTGGKAGGGFACLERTRDANKSCTRSTDCEGQCLARSGTCAPVNPLFGCNEILTALGARATICID